jgi:hypothetical protein
MSINSASRPVKIFISYSSRDRKKVEKIHGYLETAGLDVWRDKVRLETDWSREIAFALADADALCLMWSENAANSKYVKHEWLTARALEKPVYICRLGDYKDYPEPLHNRQDVPFEDIEEGGKELIRRLNNAADFRERYEYSILPKNSYIPFNPNPHFTGRQTDLLELYLKMIGNLNKIGINQVGTVGMGGIGKTQLAIEFAYRFSFAFEEVSWIQAAQTKDWQKEFVDLAKNRLQLEIINPESADTDKQYMYALQRYFKKESRKHTLVIMDNVNEPQMLNNDTFLFKKITPLTLGCDLLFTTRRHFKLRGVSAQAVDILSSKDAYDLLTQTPAEEDHANAICSAVGYLPLAIVLVSGYLSKYHDVSFNDYQEELTLLRGALRLSTNQLDRDPRQLASHLIGRLKLAEESALQQLALQAGKNSGDCCLRLVSPSLIPPGGPLLRTLEGHSARVNAVAITPDGQAAVSASSDHTLKVWDLKSGTLRHSLEGHSGDVNAVAVTPDGQAAVSASRDHTLKVWDLKSGTLLHSLEAVICLSPLSWQDFLIRRLNILSAFRRMQSTSLFHKVFLQDHRSGYH